MNAKHLMAAAQGSFQKYSASRRSVEQISLRLRDSSLRSQTNLKEAYPWRSAQAVKMCADTWTATCSDYRALSVVVRNYKRKSKAILFSRYRECTSRVTMYETNG